MDPESIGDLSDLEVPFAKSKPVPPKAPPPVQGTFKFKVRRQQNQRLLTEISGTFIGTKKLLAGLYDNVKFDAETNTFFVWDTR